MIRFGLLNDVLRRINIFSTAELSLHWCASGIFIDG